MHAWYMQHVLSCNMQQSSSCATEAIAELLMTLLLQRDPMKETKKLQEGNVNWKG